MVWQGAKPYEPWHCRAVISLALVMLPSMSSILPVRVRNTPSPTAYTIEHRVLVFFFYYIQT